MIALLLLILAALQIAFDVGPSLLTLLLLTPAAWLLDRHLLWILFLSVMHLKRVRDAGTLPSESELEGKVILVVGLLQDFFYNMSWASLEFLDFPREALVTSRLKRYKYSAATAQWRLEKTNQYARVKLDPFDPDGKHV